MSSCTISYAAGLRNVTAESAKRGAFSFDGRGQQRDLLGIQHHRTAAALQLRHMKQPSEKASSLAEEVIDFVSHGSSRADTIRELADMIDETNGELVESVTALLHDAELAGNPPYPLSLSQLRRVLSGYKPLRAGPDTQTEFFT